jgi:hypothetical protein
MGAIVDEKALWIHFSTTMIQMIQVMNQSLGEAIAVRKVIAVKIRSNIQNPEVGGKARKNKGRIHYQKALYCISFY